MCTPFSAGGGASNQIFEKKVGGGLDGTSAFRGELLGKRGMTFFRREGGVGGGLQFLHTKIN